MSGEQYAMDFVSPAGPRRCGNCIMRNAFEDEDVGYCPYRGWRHWQDEACGDWFGLEHAKRGLYGRARHGG